MKARAVPSYMDLDKINKNYHSTNKQNKIQEHRSGVSAQKSNIMFRFEDLK